MKNLEGKIEGAMPLGIPLTCVSYLNRGECSDLNKSLRGIKTGLCLHFGDRVEALSGEYLSNLDEIARFYLGNIIENHLRDMSWRAPKEADSYCQSVPKIVLIPTGMIVTSSIQYYNANTSKEERK